MPLFSLIKHLLMRVPLKEKYVVPSSVSTEGNKIKKNV